LCGIAGFTRKTFNPPASRIRDAVRSLLHRGPDQQGVFESKSVSLGATRLKILDLAGGDQPIMTDDGGVAIVFNGEIYNHLELRAEPENLGHRFRTQADTETVLRAFVEWDIECFRRLRGMFAVALWTESENRLVLARDRMGIKPLYISFREDDLLFGSELKAILIHPEIERRLNMTGLDCYLSLNYVPCPWTLVEGIEKLPPGYWLEWRNGKTNSVAYWELPFGKPVARRLETAREELNSLLAQSVREHLLSDVSLGVWLSGGIDSATVLHYAAAASRPRLKTFSLTFRDRSFDESKFIQEAAARYDTEHEQLDLNPHSGLWEAIEEFAYYSDEPSADAGALPVWFLSKLTKKSATVVLSGEGADELFGGYLTYRANQLANSMRRLPARALGFGLSALQYWPVSDEKIGFEYKLKRFVEGCRMTAERGHLHWNGTFSEEEKLGLLQSERRSGLEAVVEELREKIRQGDPLAAYLWFDQKYYLADDILTKSDRMSMAHAVEVRTPFLDHRIVEFAASLPANLKIRGQVQKFILRDTMKDKLPASILRHRKVGFDIPTHDWLRGPLRAMLIETLTAGAREHPELFRAGTLESLMRQHFERRVNIGYQLWGLLILFLWMKKWNIQSQSQPIYGTTTQAAAAAVLASI
jgi:asparagine synthase (glutamine-hydrolysing)